MKYHEKNSRWNFPHYFYKKESHLDSNEMMQQIFIDTSFFAGHPRSNSQEMKEKQLNWLRKVLAEGKDKYKWRFVYGHHVMYNSNQKLKILKSIQY